MSSEFILLFLFFLLLRRRRKTIEICTCCCRAANVCQQRSKDTETSSEKKNHLQCVYELSKNTFGFEFFRCRRELTQPVKYSFKFQTLGLA